MTHLEHAEDDTGIKIAQTHYVHVFLNTSTNTT